MFMLDLSIKANLTMNSKFFLCTLWHHVLKRINLLLQITLSSIATLCRSKLFQIIFRLKVSTSRNILAILYFFLILPLSWTFTNKNNILPTQFTLYLHHMTGFVKMGIKLKKYRWQLEPREHSNKMYFCPLAKFPSVISFQLTCWTQTRKMDWRLRIHVHCMQVVDG